MRIWLIAVVVFALLLALWMRNERHCSAFGSDSGGTGEYLQFVGCVVIMPDGTMRRVTQ